LVLAAPVVIAQSPAALTADEQKILPQIALGRARAELFDQVRGLSITDSFTVSTWLTRDIELDRALRLWVRTRPQHGKPRAYSDAVCEVDVRLEAGELGGQLVKLAGDYPDTLPAGVDGPRLKAVARGWPLLWATGRATPSKRVRPGQPVGWEDVTADGLAMAGAAATADAQRAVMEQVARLKISRTRRLRDFLDTTAEVRDAVAAEIQRALNVKVEYEADQVAVAEARLPIRELLRSLTRVHQEHFHGEDFAVADFREMVLLAGQDELLGTGLATPPASSMLVAAYAPIEHNAPDWATSALTAVGRHEPAEGETADEATRREAARLDGIERLSRQVDKLVIQKNVTVAEFGGYYQDLKDDIVLFLSGTRVTATPPAGTDGVVEAKVELPLRRLWEIVRRRMKLEEVEPTTTNPVPAGK
jgi:hypothetical protein